MDPIETFREELGVITAKAIASMGAEAAFEVEMPPSDMADYAVPCFPLAKRMRRAPAQIAEDLATLIPPNDKFMRIWAEKGYLNFKVNEDMLTRMTLDTVLGDPDGYGQGKVGKDKILLEHTSVNPTGPIHVGRARNPLIGDTMARILRRGGRNVTTEYLVNDVGKQVVLLSWGVRNVPDSEVPPSERDKTDHRLVGYYQKANQRMESDPEVSRQIADMLVRFEAGDTDVINQVGETTEMMLDGIRSTLARINVFIDGYAWESRFIINGAAKDVVARLKRSPLCFEDNGAFYLELSDYGIQGKSTKFFFTRADGTTLYTTRDLAYHLDKFTRADLAINVLGEDQKLGQTQLAAALKIMGAPQVPECVFYSFVSLPEGRMSTRKGVVVFMDDLMDEAEDRALEEVKKRRFDISEDKMFEIARQIGTGAVRFNIIRVQAEKQLIFQWEDALNFEGNSGPFVQYSHARCCSILRKAPEFDIHTDFTVLKHESEKKLIRVLALFPSIIREAGEKRKVHLLPTYAHELGSAFNQFYGSVPVLKSGEHQDARLCLVQATRWTLRNALETMGIAAPEEM